MKGYTLTRLLGLLTATALLWGASTSVYAAGTESGELISNTATLNYTIGAVAQDPATSNAATFVVDNKVDLTMVSTGAATVIPGSTNQVLPFTLTNTGNTTQGYQLSTVDGTGDNFNMNSVRIFVDVNGDGALDAGDTLYTTGTNAGDLAPDAVQDYLIVANTPSTATDNQKAIYHLLATTTNAGSATVTTEDTGADAPGTVQVVFADGAGTAGGDTARSGTQSSVSTYTVDTAALSVAKISTVISDPLNNTTDPKRIPGAVVRYTITVTNTGRATATGAAIVDQIPANTTFVTGTLSATNSDGTVTPVEAYSDDGVTYGAAETSPVGYIRVTHARILGTTAGGAGGGNGTAVFDVTIN
ncbi:MAG: DUF11 domain-containing protein [Gammaproteobacteria bacterium]|nr:DUF11 domain-containing protein [Gammaproteobacteria bacterium]